MEEKKFKILIVEDDEISRTLYKHILKNYDLSYCDSDKSMYNKLAEDKYQLIIMDIGLANSKDGLELIKELKSDKNFQGIPIICATSYDFFDQKTNALKAGADEYLSKPISKNLLISTIEKYSNDQNIAFSSEDER